MNAQKNVPTIYAYCFQSAADPNQYGVAIVEREPDHFLPHYVGQQGSASSGVKRIRLAPANPFDTNEAPAKLGDKHRRGPRSVWRRPRG